MAHTGGPVHLSLEDKTSQRKEWPEGDFAGIPAGPCGCDSCTWRAERGRPTASRRPDVQHATQFHSLFLPDLFPKYISGILFPYWALLFLFLSFIPLFSLYYTLYFLFLWPFLILPGLKLLFFLYLEPFLFFQFPKNFHSWPICLSYMTLPTFHHPHFLFDSPCLWQVGPYHLHTPNPTNKYGFGVEAAGTSNSVPL